MDLAPFLYLVLAKFSYIWVVLNGVNLAIVFLAFSTSNVIFIS